MILTHEERKRLRLSIGQSVLELQKRYPDHHPAEVVPEFIAALLSLAAYMAAKNVGMTAAEFMRRCEIVRGEQWGRK
jgi:hypothetical protein